MRAGQCEDKRNAARWLRRLHPVARALIHAPASSQRATNRHGQTIDNPRLSVKQLLPGESEPETTSANSMFCREREHQNLDHDAPRVPDRPIPGSARRY
jgi:hypothetical protein